LATSGSSVLRGGGGGGGLLQFFITAFCMTTAHKEGK